MAMRAPRDASTLSDDDLIKRSRSGDTNAFAELWKRHSRAGATVARSYTSTFDADDLVAESYAKIFQAIQAGGGPTGAFRPYLFTTIRNTAASWGRAKRETAIEDAEQIEDPAFSDDNTLAALDRSLTATAFQSLPTRWQEALWYSEVESMTPQEIAPLLAMKANAVAALTYRAREGLRQAWIQAHLSSVPADSECRWTIDRLGSYARNGLGKRDTGRVDEHLASCAKCSIVAAEAKDVGSRLALVLLPLAAGVLGATGYAAWLQSGSHVAAYALGAGGVVMPAAAVGAGGTGSAAGVGAGAGAGAGAGSGSGAGAGAGAGATAGAAAGGATGASAVVIGSVVAGVLVAAGVAAAIVLGPTLFGGTPAPKAPVAAAPSSSPSAPSSTSPSAPPSTSPSPSPTTSASPVPTAPPAVAAPAAPAFNASVTTPPAGPTAPSIGTASISSAGVLVLAGTGDPGNTVTATAQLISGGAGGTARFAVVPSSLEVGHVTVTGSGTWSLTADLTAQHLPNGTYTFSVVQSGAHGASTPATTQAIRLSVVPAAPGITTPNADQPITSGTTLQARGTGVAGDAITATLTSTDGVSRTSTSGTVATDGSWSVTVDISGLTNGTASLTVTQSNDAGPSAASTLTLVLAVPPAAPTITAPAAGSTINVGGPVSVAGNGAPGNSIEATLTRPDGTTASQHGTVTTNGTWTFTFELSASPNGAYSLQATQSNGEISSTPAASAFSIAIPPAAPIITGVDTAGDGGIDGLYLPIIRGTAVVGGTVQVSNGSTVLATIPVSNDGTWTTGQLDGFGPGENTVTAVAIDSAGLRSAPTPSAPFALLAPAVSAEATGFGESAAGYGPTFSVHVSDGIPGHEVDLLADGGVYTNAGGNPRVFLIKSGASDTDWVWAGATPGSTHAIGVRYVDGDRHGVTATASLTLSKRPTLAAALPAAGAPTAGTPTTGAGAPVGRGAIAAQPAG
ncbi:sigma-70 family RNA polymerase sigma factor [Rathayibacter soli]|uniref:sigma-70 family RNA polymerase sigma factor n=1 Tax=Rathayibacter soli TaxID=3144168 RepID=UPI0027E41F2B|nr:sigma-70 family RNA polymerase sigma factor [Glaciibacter superstes]